MSGKVLVVDDEVSMCELLSTSIASCGQPVARAHDGLAALELLRFHEISLVIADVGMPKLGGLELISRMHANGMTTPVILLTGFPDTDFLTKALRLGAIDFLLKPFSLPELKCVVERGLAISSRLRQIDELLDDVGANVAPRTHEKIELLRRQISMLRVLHGRRRSPDDSDA